MITIESVRLRNFRAIREAYFQPLERGITGIEGANGSGKTTILAGVLFALFGTRPPGASTGSLRRTGSGKEECSVSVVFKHLDQEVEVIRELRGSNNTGVLNIYVDGVEQTVTSVGTGNQWISQRLGIDATGFLTAFVVRQKELDQLINARPAERKAIIERLAGIETINEALKSARKDENNAKTTLETLPGSQAAIEEAESQVVFLNEKVENLQEARNEAQSKFQESQRLEKTLDIEVNSLKTLETDLIRSQSQKDSFSEANKLHEQTLGRLSYLNSLTEDFNIEGLRTQHKQVAASITEKTQALNELRVQRSTLKNRVDDLTTQFNSVDSWVKASQADPAEEHAFLEKRTVLNSNIETFSDSQSKASARAQDLYESVATLQHSTECPTCHTDLKDPEALTASLKSMADGFTTEAQKAAQDRAEAELALEQIGAALYEISVYNDNAKKLENLKVLLTEAQSTTVSEDEINQLEVDIEQLQKDKEVITENGIKARNILSDKELKQTSEIQLRINVQKINDLEVIISETSKKFSPERLQKAQSDLIAARSSSQYLNTVLNSSHGELSTYESRLSIANNTYKSVTEQWKRKKELLEALEKRALTTELIDKFRRESVASLTPELSENATELISDITNGAYTEIKIDDDFNISVMNSLGDERKVGELSGGEESAVALSLRLAIGLLITGRAPELLWLDEVLTAQDADRRAAMLSTIRGLPYKQIIMINHTSDALDIVDKTITVIPNLKDGSTLKTVSDSQAAIEDILDEIEDDIE